MYQLLSVRPSNDRVPACHMPGLFLLGRWYRIVHHSALFVLPSTVNKGMGIASVLILMTSQHQSARGGGRKQKNK